MPPYTKVHLTKDPFNPLHWHRKISCQRTDQLRQPKNSDLRRQIADAFSQLLQLQFFRFAQVVEQFLVKSVAQPFSILKTEKLYVKTPQNYFFTIKLAILLQIMIAHV